MDPSLSAPPTFLFTVAPCRGRALPCCAAPRSACSFKDHLDDMLSLPCYFPLLTYFPCFSRENPRASSLSTAAAVFVVAVDLGRRSSRRHRHQVRLVPGYPRPHGIELKRHEIEPASRSSSWPTVPLWTSPPPPTVSGLPLP